jgi:hypothetical protein
VPDLAVIAISAKASIGAIRDCAAVGIRHGVLWAGGFAETGAEGIALAAGAGRRLPRHRIPGLRAKFARHHQCVAAADRRRLRRASSPPSGLYRGDISMVSQSGGMAMNTQALAQEIGFGSG